MKPEPQLPLPELIQKRNRLKIEIQMGKTQNTAELIKIKRQIARLKTEESRPKK